MPTSNLGAGYLVSGQQSPEVTANAAFDVFDNVLFVRRGTLAARPASLPAGALYVATDVGNEGLYYSSAPGAWVNVTPGNGVHVNWGGGTIPTAVAMPNSPGTPTGTAGVSPPAPVVVAGSTDVRGRITFGTGTSPTAGAMVQVTFAVPYAAAPFVFVNSRSGVTLNTGAYFGGSTTTTFTIALSTTPAPSQGNGVYDVHYFVAGS
jgi:hypothetical protein